MSGDTWCLTAASNKVKLAPCTGAESQQWTFNGDTFTNEMSCDCLDVDGDGT